MRELRLSASADADFQACQRRYQLSYIHDLTADKDKDSIRIGSIWHKCHELLEMRPALPCPRCTKHEEIDPVCYICNGTGYTHNDPMIAVTSYLNQTYSIIPDNKMRDDWETERVMILYSLSGHRWLYSGEDRWEVIGSEIKFEVPVITPKGRKMPKVLFVGKIDRLVRDRNTGFVYVWERKSTGHSITKESYWSALAQGDQISGYLYGGRFAQHNGQLRKYGIEPDNPPIAGAICDVWHRPDIQPKQITKADRKVLDETGQYYGQIVTKPGDLTYIETSEMFGARLLHDITERPQHYFAQREVTRTDQELEQFQQRIYRLAKQIRYVEKQGLWVENLRSCESPFWCEFCDLCRSGVDTDPNTTLWDIAIPTGYRLKHPQSHEEEIVLV